MIGIISSFLSPIYLYFIFMLFYLPLFTIGYIFWKNSPFYTDQWKSIIKKRKKKMKIIASLVLLLELLYLILVLFTYIIQFPEYTDIVISGIIHLIIVWLSFYSTVLLFFSIKKEMNKKKLNE